MADKILSQMALFDFSVPLNTVIVEDDSDYENKESAPKKRKKSTTVDSPTAHNIVDVTSSSKEEVNIQKPIYCGNLNKNDKNCVAVKKCSNINLEKNTTEVIKPNEQICCDMNTSKTTDNVVSSSSVDDRCNKTKENVSKKTTNKTVKPNNNTDPNNDLKIMSSYLNALLNAVSHNLLMILDSYSLYMKVKKAGNKNLIDKHRNHYLLAKLHFFQLSFVISYTVIVPQAQNGTFARNFIECTVRIAKEHSINYSYEHIEPLYIEMLEWTKAISKELKKDSLALMTSKLATNIHSKNSLKEVINPKILNKHQCKINNENVENTSVPQRQKRVPKQQQQPRQHPLRTPMVPSLPNYNSVNWRRNTAVETNNYVYSNVQPQNNYIVSHSTQPYGVNYARNQIPNAQLQVIPCLINAQNHVISQITQPNSCAPQQNMNITNIHSGSLNPQFFTLNPS